jgi:ParB/RepB/Spo0J family partition protein
MTEITTLPIEHIRRHPNARPLNDGAVAKLCESIEAIGLISPIRVRGHVDGGYEIVAGHHRFAACDLIGWRAIDCIVVNDDDIHAEMAMIAENLHRAELTKLERDEQIARWIELSGDQSSENLDQGSSAEGVSSQLATKTERGRPESGVNAAARELGLKKDDAHRAIKVASLSNEAKQAARSAGLDNNRSALLEAAKHEAPEAQVKALQEHRQGGLASRYQTAAPDPAKSAERFVALADQIEAIPIEELLSSGRMRATVGQRASGLADHLSEIVERLDR